MVLITCTECREMSFNSITVIKYANTFLRYLIRRRSLTPTQDKLFA